jgi:hypothetical protein
MSRPTTGSAPPPDLSDRNAPGPPPGHFCIGPYQRSCQIGLRSTSEPVQNRLGTLAPSYWLSMCRYQSDTDRPAAFITALPSTEPAVVLTRCSARAAKYSRSPCAVPSGAAYNHRSKDRSSSGRRGARTSGSLARRRFRRFGLPISAPPHPTVLVPQAARAGSSSSCRSRRRPRRRAASTPSVAT